MIYHDISRKTRKTSINHVVFTDPKIIGGAPGHHPANLDPHDLGPTIRWWNSAKQIKLVSFTSKNGQKKSGEWKFDRFCRVTSPLYCIKTTLQCSSTGFFSARVDFLSATAGPGCKTASIINSWILKGLKTVVRCFFAKPPRVRGRGGDEVNGSVFSDPASGFRHRRLYIVVRVLQ